MAAVVVVAVAVVVAAVVLQVCCFYALSHRVQICERAFVSVRP